MDAPAASPRGPSPDAPGLVAVLVAGGLDPSGGAGLAADLWAVHRAGCHALPVATAWTAQDAAAVRSFAPVPPAQVRAMLDGAAATVRPGAIKLGMLADAGVACAIADWLDTLRPSPPLVIDPVLAASDGTALLDPPGLDVLRRRLLPRAALVTPNGPEAAALLGRPGAPAGPDEAEALAGALVDLGPQAVVVTGGHGTGDPVDVLVRTEAGVRVVSRFARPRRRDARGTGCRLAALCAARLAGGADVEAAVRWAGDVVHDALGGPRLSGARIVGPT